MKRPSIYRRYRKKKRSYAQDWCPQWLIDIIKEEYPDRYAKLPDNLALMFTEQEWINILTKSRISYKKRIRLKRNLIKKRR